MARLIMAGVATVDMFDGDKLFGSATTLTESSLNIGISAEDIRGGEGAGMLGRYFHTSTFELTLTDALFNLDYIAASVGANVDTGADVMANEEHEVTGTTITLNKLAVPFCADGDINAWFKSPAADEWTLAPVSGTDTHTITVPAAGKYCVKYFYKNDAASKIRIKSDYVPKTLRLVLKENLYAAGETNSNTTKVGYILINIPRFQLDGSQELSMSMTGASTTSLKGMALISDGCSAGCDGAGYYADMIQVLEGAQWFDGIMGIAVDGGKLKGESVSFEDDRIYAIYKNKTPKLITEDMLKITRKVEGKDTVVTLTLGVEGGMLVLKEGATVIASGAIVTGA